MSQFVRMIDEYCERNRIGRNDRRKLLAHYPLFKLAWLSSYGSGAPKRLSHALLRPFKGYRITHEIGTPAGRMVVPVSFDEDDLASFKEVFLGDEYAPPFDLSDARTYVDLGANTGMAALYFAARAPLETMLLVEANPALLSTLQRNVRSLGDRVRLENRAVAGRGNPDGIRFYLSDNHRHASARPEVGGRAVTVACSGLRALLDEHDLADVDILKIDIEGSEHDIVEADAGVLGRARALFAEVHGDDDQRGGFVERLRSIGFEIAARSPHPESFCETVVARRT